MNPNRNRHCVYYVLQLTWGILQNVIGFGIWLYLRLIERYPRPRFRFHGAFVTEWNLNASAGCGMFIFLARGNLTGMPRVLVHEYGHTIQSCILGPLFLPFIAVPSLIWANTPVFTRNRSRGKYCYSSFYPEAWANELGRRFTGMPAIDY